MNSDRVMESPVIRFTVLCDGSPSGYAIRKIEPTYDAYVFEIPPSGNTHFKNSAMWIRLELSMLRRYDANLMIGLAELQIDGTRAGIPSPWCCWIGDWPQAPAGLLHWTNRVPVWENGRPTDARVSFSLMSELMPASA